MMVFDRHCLSFFKYSLCKNLCYCLLPETAEKFQPLKMRNSRAKIVIALSLLNKILKTVAFCKNTAKREKKLFTKPAI